MRLRLRAFCQVDVRWTYACCCCGMQLPACCNSLVPWTEAVLVNDAIDCKSIHRQTAANLFDFGRIFEYEQEQTEADCTASCRRIPNAHPAVAI
jgi:hypothetical protein